ncbi:MULTISPECIES: TetR/AcrR family transcriptional regulator [unclassified Brevibacterium]|uniref:TetR/AcrR family transcriptional regulator n=1 Tax=unclassified Brevibacterium TaxID=2614124 RepID=UPI001091F00D|nr:TetR/AcrR family transcriptional regulator [Brevibacterium sp. S22]TGD29381.1 TetR/AcrR family transcriptional regulator [Brevibacterium sp. S22]
MDLSRSGERILATATALFYAEGVNAIGVDRIVAEAGVSKPTLYAQFGSKAGLIAEVLRRRRETRESAIAEALASSASSPDSHVLALFDWFIEGHAKPGFRGCPFTIAAAELPDPDHPARAEIARYKTWLQTTLADLAAADGLGEPQRWGSALMFLVDGANARVITTGESTAMSEARQVAATMIDAARQSAAAATSTTADAPATAPATHSPSTSPAASPAITPARTSPAATAKETR